jgi:DNA-binding Lrp family transcriptional regulator
MSTTRREHPATVTLSERHLRLIHALQRSPRASWEAIAATVDDGSTPRALAGRWRALQESGVAWLAPHPGPRWWAGHLLAWVTLTPAAADVPGVAGELAEDPTVLSVDVDHSGAVLAAVALPTYDDLGTWLGRRPARVPSPQVDIATHLHTSLSRWRVGALPGDDSRATDIPTPVGQRPSDTVVRDLIAALAPDPRAPIPALADILGRQERTVRRQLGAMLRDGDVAIAVELVGAAVGRPISAHWWLRAARPAALARALVGEPDVRSVVSVVSRIGGATTLASASLPSREAMHQLVARVAQACPDAVTEAISMTWRAYKRLGWTVDPVSGRRLAYVPLDI